MESQKQKSCCRCGLTFGCTTGHGCWCNDVSLSREHLQWIEEHYDDCLCPDCLIVVSEGNQSVEDA